MSYPVVRSLLLTAFTMVLVLLGSSSVCLAEEPVAFVVRVIPKSAWEKKLIVVKRQGINIDFAKDMTQALYLGDRIYVLSPLASLTIYVNNQQEQQITSKLAGKDGYVLQVKPNNLWRNLVTYLLPMHSASTCNTVATATRSLGKKLKMPADAIEPPPKLAAGERVLHFRWDGGRPPYRLTISRDGSVVYSIDIADKHIASLPKRDWLPGVYQLTLKHSVDITDIDDSDFWQEDRLTFVDPAIVPSMPQDLVQSKIPEDMRKILYANWLSRQDEGGWVMEAIQHVVPQSERNLAAANWLRQWGGE